MSFKALLAPAALLGLLAGAVIYYYQHGMRPERDGPARLAVIHFDNQTGDPAYDWVERVLPAAVVRQAEGLPSLRAFPADTANRALALNATHLLHGYVAVRGGAPRLHYSLEIAARRRTRATGEAVPRSTGWLGLVRSLAEFARDQLRPGAELLPLDVVEEPALRLLGQALLAESAATRSALLEQAVQADPRCAWCWETLTRQTLQTGGPAAALPLLERALQQAAGMDETGLLRLRLIEAGVRRDSAQRLETLEKLAARLPSDPAILVPLAEALIAARRVEDAIAAYRRAHEAEPSRSDLLNMLGYATAWAGRFDDALNYIRQYEAAEPASANPPDSRGEILLMAGRFAEAETAFLASHEKDPSFNGGVALEKSALSRWLSGDVKGAGELLEKYLKERASRRDPLVTLRRARWQYLLGQATEAQTNLRLLAGRAENPGAALAASFLSVYGLHAGRLDDARRYAAVARQSARDSLSLYVAGVASYLADPAAGDPPGNDPATKAQLRALALTLHGDLDSAAQAWEDALAATPAGSDALCREVLAQVSLAQGHADRASTLVRTVWPLLTPDQMLLFDFLVYPELFYVRGELARQASKEEEARRYYEQFLQSVGSRPDRLGLARRAREAVRL